MRILLTCLFLVGCGGSGGGGSNAPPAPVTPSPSSVQAVSNLDGSITVSWVNGSDVFYSTDSALNPDHWAVYENADWKQNVSSPLTIQLDKPGKDYYVVVVNDDKRSSAVRVVTRYVANDDLVTDLVTNLTWARCSMGQAWDGSTCTGEAERFTVDEAKHIHLRTEGYRLPDYDDLMTLVNTGYSPAIFHAAFPNKPAVPFFSTTIFTDFYPFRVIDFSDGKELKTGDQAELRIRLLVD